MTFKFNETLNPNDVNSILSSDFKDFFLGDEFDEIVADLKEQEDSVELPEEILSNPNVNIDQVSGLLADIKDTFLSDPTDPLPLQAANLVLTGVSLGLSDIQTDDPQDILELGLSIASFVKSETFDAMRKRSEDAGDEYIIYDRVMSFVKSSIRHKAKELVLLELISGAGNSLLSSLMNSSSEDDTVH